MAVEPSLGPPRACTGLSFVVTPAAGVWRARLGSTAWVALEELLAEATRGSDGAIVARTSVRRMAAYLGISKDTAAGALRRLAADGVVARVAPIRGTGGTFGAGGYAIEVEAIGGVSVVDAPAARPASSGGRRRRAVTEHQPALFELDGEAPE